MLKLVFLSIVIVALSGLMMSLTIIFKKNGKFPQFMVGHNKEMRKRKIYCAKTQDRIELNKIKKEIQIKKTDKKLNNNNCVDGCSC